MSNINIVIIIIVIMTEKSGDIKYLTRVHCARQNDV